MFVIEGDPREVGPFAMRLWFPAGIRVAPHFHPGVRRTQLAQDLYTTGLEHSATSATGTIGAKFEADRCE
jgi:hypothetical protein